MRRVGTSHESQNSAEVRPASAGATRPSHHGGVAGQGVAVEVVEHQAGLVLVGRLPRLLQRLVRGPVEGLVGVLRRDERAAEGPERAEGEVAAQPQSVGIALGVGDQLGPLGAEPAGPGDGVPRGIDPGDLDAAEAVGLGPVELVFEDLGRDRAGEPPPARVRPRRGSGAAPGSTARRPVRRRRSRPMERARRAAMSRSSSDMRLSPP